MLAKMLAVIASVGAVAPPRIALELEGMTSSYRLAQPIVRAHDLGYRNPDGTDVMSRQDWTEKCPASLTGTTEELAQKCPFPVAKGYDHHDQMIGVSTRVYLVDKAGEEMKEPKKITPDDVDFHARSTYLFKYDAMDRAGNHAEQVVFALIIDDETAPQFASNCASSLSVEAASSWALCELHALDNIDGDLTNSVKYSVKKIEGMGQAEDELMPKDCDTFKCAKQVFTPQTQTGKHDCDHHSNCGPVNLGKFLITATVHDKAGVYGHQSADNIATTHVAILVTDTQAPVIQLIGHDNTYHECVSDTNFANPDVREGSREYHSMQYIDRGADALDMLDTWALKKTPKKYTTTPTVYTFEDGPIPGTTFFNTLEDHEMQHPYTIEYTALDEHSNKATPITRTVITVDTLAPTIVLKGLEIQDEYEGMTLTAEQMQAKNKKAFEAANVAHQAGRESGADATVDDLGLDEGVVAVDMCDDKDLSITMSWGPKPWNVRKLGKYVRTYTATDKRHNAASVSRTFEVVDTEEPEIVIQGEDNTTYEASRDIEYTDKGAKCTDFIDGDRSHAVEVSGEIVNMRIPGVYHIRYDCSDLSGNAAVPKFRKVTIRDTMCPDITLIGAALNYVEAGFPYVDMGASATDTLDGDITSYIWTNGNTVTTSQAFYSKRNCEDIKQGLLQDGQSAENGEYFITTILTDEDAKQISSLGAHETSRFHRVLVHCWMGPSPAVTFKIFEIKDCEHLHHDLSMDCHKQQDCPLLGMKKLEPDAALKTYVERVKPNVLTWDDGVGDKVDTTYLCRDDNTPEKTSNWGAYTAAELKYSKFISTAEQGKYVIQYHVSDKADNAECRVTKRTVIVKDTLPPVISLHLHKEGQMKLIHRSEGGQVGINGEKNPAGLTEEEASSSLHPHMYNPHLKDYKLMAERSSASDSAWLVAATVSAVAGMAMLGYSSRSTQGPVVPV